MSETAFHLKDQSIPKLVVKMALPATVGWLGTALYTAVDVLYISHFIDKPNGTSYAVSAMQLIAPFTLVALAFLLLLSTGASTLLSIFMGAEKHDKAERILGNSFTLLTIGGILIAAAGLLFKREIFFLMGAAYITPATYSYAMDYYTIICSGTVFLAIGYGLSDLIRAEGNPKLSMIIMGTGAMINLLVDPVLLGVFHLGVKGSAYSTIFSQAVSSGIAVWHYLSGRSVVKFRVRNLLPDMKLAFRAFYMGLAQFILQISTGFVSYLYNHVLGLSGGDRNLAAYNVNSAIGSLFIMCLLGISDGVQPIFGYNYGAKRYDRVKDAFNWAIVLSTFVLTIGFALCIAFPRLFVSIFAIDAPTKEIAVYGLRLQVLAWPLIALSFIAATYFQSIGKPIMSLSVALCRQVIFLVPSVLIMTAWWNMTGFWLAAPVSDLLSTVLAFFLIKYSFKRLNTEH